MLLVPNAAHYGIVKPETGFHVIQKQQTGSGRAEGAQLPPSDG